MLKRTISIFPLLLLLTTAVAQFPNFGSLTQSTGGSGGSQREYVYDPDSFGVFQYFADNPNEFFPFRDSLLDNFEAYDPIQKQDWEYAHLGNVGSAHRQLFFQPTFHRGYDIGFHQYDLYQTSAATAPYYRITKNAFSRAYYSQQGQNNHIFKGEYSRNFTDGINFTIDYLRMRHQGQYISQETSNNAFASTVWYHAKGGRYDAYLSVNSSTMNEQDNGGVDTASFTSANLAQSFTVPVLLATNGADANTRHVTEEYSYTHYFKLIGGPPKAPKRSSADTLYQPPFLLKDSLGNALRDSTIRMDSLQNEVIDSLQQDSIPPTGLSDSLALPPNLLPPVDTIPKDSLMLDSLPPQNRPLRDSLNRAKPGPKDQTRPNRKGPPNWQQQKRPDFNPNSPSTPVEPTGPPKRAVTLIHQIGYKRSRYKFSETNSPPDSDFYGNFAVHRRGLRHFIQHKRLENSFRISTFKLRNDRNAQVQAEQDLLEVGLTHSIHFIDQEAEQSTVSNLFLTGKWNFSPNDRLKVKTYSHLGFWDNGGDYRLSGDFFFDFKKAGKLKLQAMHQRYAPTLVQDRIYVSEIPIWDHDFSKTFETSIGGTYTLPWLKLEVSGHYHLINNYIYFDTLATPQQTGTPISIVQLMVKKNFKVWAFHLDNTFILQQNSSDFIRLPKYYTINSLYFEGHLYKRVLFSRIAVDFRFNGEFMADRFHALSGQFYQQNALPAKPYPALDAFISFKVERFRFFAKWENILGNSTTDLFYLSGFYPQRYFGFRFGISWRFRN